MYEVRKCDYCGETKETRGTPIMADVPAHICEPCWNVTREGGIAAEGIDVGSFWIDPASVLGDVPPESCGCWYCHHKTEGMHFSMEFDAYLHLGCLKAHLKFHPDDLEALIFARELVAELGMDPEELQARIDALV